MYSVKNGFHSDEISAGPDHSALRGLSVEQDAGADEVHGQSSAVELQINDIGLQKARLIPAREDDGPDHDRKVGDRFEKSAVLNVNQVGIILLANKTLKFLVIWNRNGKCALQTFSRFADMSRSGRLLFGAISFGNLRGGHLENALVQLEDLLLSAAWHSGAQFDRIGQNEYERILSVAGVPESGSVLFLGQAFGQIHATHHATCKSKLELFC